MKPLDPLDLTRRLVDIESLTYNEGAVGAYLDTLLQEYPMQLQEIAAQLSSLPGATSSSSSST